MLATLRKAVRMVPPRTAARWLLLVPLVVASAAAEAAGAAGVFLLVRILNSPDLALELPGFTRFAAAVGLNDSTSIVIAFTLALAIFYVAKNVLALATEYLRGVCVGSSTASVARTMLRGYLGVPYAFHFKRNSAELIRNAHESVDRIFAGVLAQAVGLITESLVVLSILTVLILAAPWVTLTAGLVLLLVSILFSRATRRLALRLGDQMQLRSRDALQQLQQSLHAIKEIKVLGREEFFHSAFGRAEDGLARARYTANVLAGLPRLVIETVFICGALFVLIVLISSGAPAADSLSLLGLYAYAGFRVIPSVNRILWHVNVIRSGSRAVDDVLDDYLAFREQEQVDADPSLPLRFEHSIELHDVSYPYEGHSTPTLSDIDVSLARGSFLGIVGRTGAGKSTLVDILVGLLQPTRGRVLVDGESIAGKTRAWQRQIGYVPQAPYLLDGTLRENIALGIAPAKINDAAVAAAVALAQLQEFVDALPQRLDTFVGERGLRLSGGQRQRVAIARALYHQPAVLVFDEATSALDLETERRLAEAIRALHGVKTVILVAHRLATLSDCDMLLFLRDGRIAGRGSFTSLISTNADFRAMATIE